MKLVWLTLLAAAVPSVMGNPEAADADVANEARAEAKVGKYADYGSYPPKKGGYGKYANYGKYTPPKGGYGKYASYGKYQRDAEDEEEQ